jgi:DNA-binding PadR family transcriptional regulator
MPLHHALLALLAHGESYGYELKTAVDRSVAPGAGALNIGHVYQVLDRLRRDGLVADVRAEAHGGRPERRVYAITPAGREELARWLAEPAGPMGGYRDDFWLKLVAAARTGEPALRDLLARERQALLGELRSLREQPGDALTRVLIDGAALQTEARLRLLDRVEERAAEIVAAALAATPPAAGAAPDAAAGRG